MLYGWSGVDSHLWPEVFGGVENVCEEMATSCAASYSGAVGVVLRISGCSVEGWVIFGSWVGTHCLYICGPFLWMSRRF